MANNRLIEILNSNTGLLEDLLKSKFLQNEILGMLKSIEATIPEECRENFYNNLSTLRICFNHDKSFCVNNSTVINLDKRLIYLAENNTENKFKEELLMEAYHELLHLASNTIQVIDGEVRGNGGLQEKPKIQDGKMEFTDEYEELTEGLSQLLTLRAFGKKSKEDTSKYSTQVEKAKILVKKVGLDTMKRVFFNNRNGMEPVKKKLIELHENPNLCAELENECHLKNEMQIAGFER